jgi:hypothetical protein
MSTQQKVNLRFSVIAGLILMAAFSRIIPHMPNFSPLGAIGLFGAAHFSKKWQALLIPIAATWLSDLFINNVIYGQYYPKFTWFSQGFYWTYGTYLLITIIGFFIFRKSVTAPKVLGGALVSTVLFFLITNFACWPTTATNPTYTQDFSGLMACYAAGVPFIKGSLLGDLFYSGVLFGAFALLQQNVPSLRLKRRIAY